MSNINYLVLRVPVLALLSKYIYFVEIISK